MTPDQHLGVVEARREYTHPHLAPAGGRQGSVDHLQPLRITEATDLNNAIARLHDDLLAMSQSSARTGPLPQLLCIATSVDIKNMAGLKFYLDLAQISQSGRTAQ